MMIAAQNKWRALELAVLLWSGVLASTCWSFSVVSPGVVLVDTRRIRGIRTTGSAGLHAGPPVREPETTTVRSTISLTSLTADASGSDDNANANANDEPTTTTTVSSESSRSSSSSSSSSSLSTTLFPKNKQVLKFVEPKTNVTVMLIGSMHYNPASIQLVESTVDDLGKTNRLASVIIESCDIRWNKTQEMMDKKRAKLELQFAKTNKAKSNSNNNSNSNRAEEFIDSNPNDKDFLGNEMRAAWEVATKYHRPTILGDQRINITIAALKSSLKDTATDLFLGGPSGWKRSRDEIAANWKTTIPISAGKPAPTTETSAATAATDNIPETRYLNAFAFFDPRLLISLPVSLVKYPLSFLIKDPIPVGAFFSIIALLNFYGTDTGLLDATDFSFDDWVAAATQTKTYPWTDYVVSFGVAVLETVVFARLLLKPLLADRNEILARSVLDQCLLYADDGTTTTSNNNKMNDAFGNFFRNLLSQSPLAVQSPTDGEAPVYVPGSDPESMMVAEQLISNRNNKNSSSNEGKVVVAVLGMAHCNGVMKLLREQKV